MPSSLRAVSGETWFTVICFAVMLGVVFVADGIVVFVAACLLSMGLLVGR